jgi:hypothetical protein
MLPKTLILSSLMFVAIGAVFGGSAAKWNWEVRSPSPTLESLYGVEWIGSKIVVTGEHGIVLTSADGNQWVKTRITHSAGDMIDLWQLAKSEKELVMASNIHGVIWRSTDGVAWTAHAAGSGRSMIYSLSYSDGRFVALATSGTGRSQVSKMLTSPDGIAWTERPLGIGGVSLHKALWTGSQFVAIGLQNSKWEGLKAFFGKSAKIDTPVTAVSGDGETWSVTELPLASGGAGAKALTWTGSLLVAVFPSGEIFTSPDGVSWTLQYTARDVDLTNVVWTGSRLVVLGTSLERGHHGKAAILISTDGKTWAKANPADGAAKLSNVAWAGDQFVAVGYNGQILSSKDGANWAQKSPIGATGTLTKITSSGGKLVAVGAKTLVFSSDEGKHWIPGAVPDDFQMNSVVGNGHRFVAVGRGGAIFLSSDGESWSAKESECSQELKDAVWTGTQFVCVGIDDTKSPSGALVLTSTDGNKWMRRPMPDETGGLCAVVWTSQQLVAVGHRGTVVRSNDGSEWSKARGGDMLPDLEAVAWSGKTFAAVGRASAMSGNKAILCSDDGLVWTDHPGTGPVLLFGIAWTNDRFIAVGERGVVNLSPDGHAWSYDSLCTSQLLNDVCWDGKAAYAVGTGGVVITATPQP